ncbi:immunity 49 family protein [Kitasatospora sp. NBC_01266]|uniref:immunity 49 family protein n=1 Tax=Kitasatospora sp. NBC_01266 TaxID=2903572 RepID=UPI002E2EC51B|nr:immunity 49 family protein [Kitasatospora sp. NBC_01266]
MAVTVTRHDFPTANAVQGLETLGEDTREAIDDLEDSPRWFNNALSAALMTAQAHCAVDPVADKFATWEAYVSAMQVGSALFASAVATEGTVQCRIAGKTRTIAASGPQYYANPAQWLTSFWLAVICREQGRMTQLANVPLSLLRESGVVIDEYAYAWVDTLQTYWLQGPELVEKLGAAMDGTDPEVLRVADRELVLKQLYPPINLFYRFLRQDHERFNAELANALRWHQEYWTKDAERACDIRGLVALGPLAIACLAYDAGFPIEVESEYLPKHLLQRSWLGEFDT